MACILILFEGTQEVLNGQSGLGNETSKRTSGHLGTVGALKG